MAKTKPTTKLIRTISYGSIVEHCNDIGIRSFLTLDSRGYWLATDRFGGYGWPNRKEALQTAFRRAQIS